jgi:plasmid stabilization system protein ParE
VFERRRISLSSEARKDLRETYDFYESEEVGVGCRFVRHLVQTLQAISERPNWFPLVQPGRRRAIMHKFPYGVFFRDVGTHLDVYAIVDLRRHPRQWSERP